MMKCNCGNLMLLQSDQYGDRLVCSQCSIEVIVSLKESWINHSNKTEVTIRSGKLRNAFIGDSRLMGKGSTDSG